MRWKQFFTPVKSLNCDQTKEFMRGKSMDQINLLDVRQPSEYESGHLPGAKLIPVPDLNERIGELDPEKPTVVYWAVGGRSRVAAQMLAGKGFSEVINMAGGIKAWNSQTALGDETLGLDLFNGKESPQDTLVVAFSLEAGLQEFYETMTPKVTNENTRNLFAKLATIEVKHQQRILEEYNTMSERRLTMEEFAVNIAAPVMEGGLTTDEYLDLYKTDMEIVEEVIALAMAIEAQALDLYQRAAEQAENEDSRDVLRQIANEENAHLEQLGKLFETL